MRTVGKKWRGPKGDYAATCDYCGVRWPRSKLRRDHAGLLVCPDEGTGLDRVALDEANAALTRPRPAWPHDGGNFDTTDVNEGYTHKTKHGGIG